MVQDIQVTWLNMFVDRHNFVPADSLRSRKQSTKLLVYLLIHTHVTL